MLRYAAHRSYEAVRFMVECLGFGTSRGLLAAYILTHLSTGVPLLKSLDTKP